MLCSISSFKLYTSTPLLSSSEGLSLEGLSSTGAFSASLRLAILSISLIGVMILRNHESKSRNSRNNLMLTRIYTSPNAVPVLEGEQRRYIVREPGVSRSIRALGKLVRLPAPVHPASGSAPPLGRTRCAVKYIHKVAGPQNSGASGWS